MKSLPKNKSIVGENRGENGFDCKRTEITKEKIRQGKKKKKRSSHLETAKKT